MLTLAILLLPSSKTNSRLGCIRLKKELIKADPNSAPRTAPHFQTVDCRRKLIKADPKLTPWKTPHFQTVDCGRGLLQS